MNVTLQRMLCNVHNIGALFANGSHSGCPEVGGQGSTPLTIRACRQTLPRPGSSSSGNITRANPAFRRSLCGDPRAVANQVEDPKNGAPIVARAPHGGPGPRRCPRQGCTRLRGPAWLFTHADAWGTDFRWGRQIANPDPQSGGSSGRRAVPLGGDGLWRAHLTEDPGPDATPARLLTRRGLASKVTHHAAAWGTDFRWGRRIASQDPQTDVARPSAILRGYPAASLAQIPAKRQHWQASAAAAAATWDAVVPGGGRIARGMRCSCPTATGRAPRRAPRRGRDQTYSRHDESTPGRSASHDAPLPRTVPARLRRADPYPYFHFHCILILIPISSSLF